MIDKEKNRLTTMIVYGEHRYRIQCVRLAKMDLNKEDEENRTNRYIFFFLFRLQFLWNISD